MLPADRQLVCNSSMISPRAMDFSGLVTCWVCSWFSICTVWVGKHAPSQRGGWQGSCPAAFNKKGIVWWRLPPRKSLDCLSSFMCVCLLGKWPTSLWKTPENSGLELRASFTLPFQRDWHVWPNCPCTLLPHFHARYIIEECRTLSTPSHLLNHKHHYCQLPCPKKWCLRCSKHCRSTELTSEWLDWVPRNNCARTDMNIPNVHAETCQSSSRHNLSPLTLKPGSTNSSWHDCLLQAYFDP